MKLIKNLVIYLLHMVLFPSRHQKKILNRNTNKLQKQEFRNKTNGVFSNQVPIQKNKTGHLNIHGTSWQQTAKIALNADNGGNEYDSPKIAQETPPEI